MDVSMRIRIKNNLGFTLLEILIAVAIVAVLAAIAIPSYMHYMSKSHYSELIQMGDRYKIAVAFCLEDTKGVMASCDGGAYDIPDDISSGSGIGQVDAVSVVDSVITVTPKAENGISASDTYILTPTYSSNGVTWTVSGGGCADGLISGGC